MVPAIVCALLLSGGPGEDVDTVLRAKLDSRGRFSVTSKQLAFLRKELASADIKRVEKLLHPDGIIRRFVWWGGGKPTVDITRDTKKGFIGWVTSSERLKPDTWIWTAGLTEQSGGKWVKLAYNKWRTGDTDSRPEGWGPIDYLHKYRPIHYLRLAHKNGRLWIREYSYGHGEAE